MLAKRVNFVHSAAPARAPARQFHHGHPVHRRYPPNPDETVAAMNIRRQASLLLVAVTVALAGTVPVAGLASVYAHLVTGDYAGPTGAAASGQVAINRSPTRPVGFKVAVRLEGSGDGDETTPELPVPAGWPSVSKSAAAGPALLPAHLAVSPPRPLQGRAQIPRAPPFGTIV